MKILFSPSEGKKESGDNPPIGKDSFIFQDLYEKREEVLERYNYFLATASDEQLSRLFGIQDSSKFYTLRRDIFTQPTLKAAQRYTGVAFDYLGYNTLPQLAQNYIDNNSIIFSNLFGPILAGQPLPQYKLKQGEKIGDFAPEIFYKKYFSQSLDEMLQDEVLLDLRAGFYTKFYKLTSPNVSLKFLKDGKNVSHWAKAYRGLVLKQIALQDINNIEEFYKMDIENLKIEHIVQKKIHTEVIFNILS